MTIDSLVESQKPYYVLWIYYKYGLANPPIISLCLVQKSKMVKSTIWFTSRISLLHSPHPIRWIKVNKFLQISNAPLLITDIFENKTYISTNILNCIRIIKGILIGGSFNYQKIHLYTLNKFSSVYQGIMKELKAKMKKHNLYY